MKFKLTLTSLAAIVSVSLPAFAEDTDDEIAMKLSNPVASMISVPFQFNWDTGMGPLDDGWQFKLNFQPVVPVSLNEDWNLIVRTIVPYIIQEDVFKGPAAEKGVPYDRWQNGLGDITQSFFFSPTKPVGGWTLGFGPVIYYPSATDDLLGAEKWAAGPTLLMLRQQHGWTYGFLANHLWSFAGDDSRTDLSATFVQPFLSYQTKTKTTIGINTEATYDWNESQWTVPVNGFVSQLVRIGKMPVSFTVGGRYYAEGPSGAPEWGLRFVVTLVFPEGGEKHAPDHKSFRK
jgi:hypothetical protein